MTRTNTADRQSQRSPDKRRAILEGARVVFAREGYTRASIDTIAAQAEVSTRTVYNHFGGKVQLFSSVIQASASEVAEAQLALIERYLGEVTNLEDDFVAFGRAWTTATPDYATHFALVNKIRAEAGHLPPAVLEAWQEAGPRRVHRELTRVLTRLAERGLLAIDDPGRAAIHLATLATAEVDNRTYQGTFPISEEEITTMVTAGIRAFLYGYRARPGEAAGGTLIAAPTPKTSAWSRPGPPGRPK
jgi:AcrR family transcriptional regulator